MKKIALILVILASSALQPVLAQYSTKGVFIKPHLVGAAWSINEIDEPDHSGGGLGLAVGYGISERFSVLIDLSGAQMETRSGASYTLAHFDVGAQVVMTKEDSPFKVYVDASATARTARFEVLGANIDLNGSGGTLGFGLLYFMSEKIALDGGVRAMFGNIDEISGGGEVLDVTDIRANSTRVNFGIAWFVNQ